MANKIYDGLLALFSAVTGVQTGTEYIVYRTGDDKVTHLTVNIVLSAGTATWILEGRNGPNDTWVQIDTGTASKSEVIAYFPRYRFRLSASAGPATIRASLNRVLQPA